MKTCPTCQQAYPDNAEFCGHDGTPLAAVLRDERECPYCAEKILTKARVCKHCGHEAEPLVGSGISVQAPPPAPQGRIVEAPTAHPQRSEPVGGVLFSGAAASRPPSATRAPQFRMISEPPRKMKFVVIAIVVLVVMLVSGVIIWQHEKRAAFDEKVEKFDQEMQEMKEMDEAVAKRRADRLAHGRGKLTDFATIYAKVVAGTLETGKYYRFEANLEQDLTGIGAPDRSTATWIRSKTYLLDDPQKKKEEAVLKQLVKKFDLVCTVVGYWEEPGYGNQFIIDEIGDCH